MQHKNNLHVLIVLNYIMKLHNEIQSGTYKGLCCSESVCVLCVCCQRVISVNYCQLCSSVIMALRSPSGFLLCFFALLLLSNIFVALCSLCLTCPVFTFSPHVVRHHEWWGQESKFLNVPTHRPRNNFFFFIYIIHYLMHDVFLILPGLK